jgi:diguanylate cyclase (GGDEF)-like protein
MLNNQLVSKKHAVFAQFDLSSCSVIGELPLYDVTIHPKELIRNVMAKLDLVPDMPGIIVSDGNTNSAISRERLHEWLSRPFGNELFLNRPISKFLSSIDHSCLSLPETMRIDDSVKKVLDRPTTDIHEPIIVECSNRQVKLLDFHVLLLAQTQLLSQANYFISQQLESGKVLSHIMDLPDMLSQILHHLSRMIQFDQAAIVLVDPDMQHYPHTSLQAMMTNHTSSETNDIIFDRRASSSLIRSRQSLLITHVEGAEEWLNPSDFPHVGSWIGFPFVYSNQVVCLLSLTRLRGSERGIDPFSRSDLDMIASLSSTLTAAIRNAHLHAELRLLAVTDPLTGIYNRRGFYETTQKSYENHAASGSHCSVLILDIDFFKRINDMHGHRVGDIVIRNVVQVCRKQLRDGDLLGRYGGEEFIIFLPNTRIEEAKIVAERLRDTVAHHPIQNGSGTTFVTVSIGVSDYQSENLSLELLIQRADEAMYNAKRLGRDRVECWQSSSGLPPMTGVDPAVHEISHSDRFATARILDHRLTPELTIIRPLLSVAETEHESILGWVRAMEMRENQKEHHGQEAADLTTHLCRLVGFAESDLIHIYRGAILHDIGKLAIPDQIYNKPGPLDDLELEMMRKHVELGYQILMPISYLRPALAIPYCHHEKWDGSGYPRRLSKYDIPIEARIFAFVDVWHALTSDRCYRPAWPEDKAIAYIRSQAGIHFDPDLVDLFLSSIQQKTI